MLMAKYKCTVCDCFASPFYTRLITHIRHEHQSGPSMPVICGINGCMASFTTDKCESLRSHVNSKHRLYLRDTSAPSIPPPSEEFNSAEAMTLSMDTHVGEQHEDEGATTTSKAKKAKSIKDMFAGFLIKCLEERKMSQSAVEGIVEDISNIWHMVMKDVLNTLAQAGADVNMSEEILNPFKGLENVYRITKYMEEHFEYQPPIERVLGSVYMNRGGRHVEVTDKCYDIPLIHTLQKLLKTETVTNEVLKGHSQPVNSEKRCDYCDGDLYRHHPLFQSHPNSLQIHLYYDEVDVCNPIGSRRTIHKLGMFYFSLSNLSPHLRSSLKSIYLVNVTYFSDIEKYGIDKILEPLMYDIKLLEQGVIFHLADGSTCNLYGTLTVVSADNLSAQLIGGYKALNAAFRKCRDCYATDEDMQILNSDMDIQCKLRTRDEHDYHCKSLETPIRDLENHIATTFGITKNSILNTSAYFHVVLCLIMDCMHDFLEGIVQLHTKEMLKHCISHGMFTVEKLNQRLAAFHFSKSDAANKPTPLCMDKLRTDDGKLCESASQMWCLARALPLLIGDLIPDEDEIWKNFIQLLVIMEYVFAPIITEPMINHLQQLIEMYLVDFKQLFPDRRVTPKMHYIIHVATWIKRCGPLVHSWCMRFEAKHCYFKYLARVSRNFKNIPKTFATRHQRYMCWLLSEKKAYLKEHIVCGRGKQCAVGDLDMAELMIAKVGLGLTLSTSVYSVKKVTIRGMEYSKGNVVILPPSKTYLPNFGQIINIYVLPDGKCIFQMTAMEVVEYNIHFNAYQVQTTSSCTILLLQTSEFLDIYPLVLNRTFSPTMQDASFVILKHMYISK